jgi:hypothetical protein
MVLHDFITAVMFFAVAIPNIKKAIATAMAWRCLVYRIYEAFPIEAMYSITSLSDFLK